MAGTQVRCSSLLAPTFTAENSRDASASSRAGTRPRFGSN
jgi:hypothetical protein